MLRHFRWISVLLAVCCPTPRSFGEVANPVLESVFPPGGQAGARFEVEVSGSSLEELSALRCSHRGIEFSKIMKNRFHVEIAANTPPGFYDVCAVTADGITAPRTFFVSRRSQTVETAPNDTAQEATPVALPGVVSGRIEKPGDVDHYRFDARAGQRVVVTCWAERIDSALHPVLELYDPRGQRVLANPPTSAIDPILAFVAPLDGGYTVRLHDLTYTGGPGHFYRLDVHTGAQVAFAVPALIHPSQPVRVTLFGWNLKDAEKTAGAINSLAANPSRDHEAYDQIDVEIAPRELQHGSVIAFPLKSEQATVDYVAYYYRDADYPILLSTSDVPVIREAAVHASPANAQPLEIPGEVSGQLVASDEHDWYVISARRGEVFWLEGFGQRIGSAVDLDIRVLDLPGERELAHFSDELNNLGGRQFPSNHLDPAGRWVAPADGRYLIVVQSLIGDLGDDPSRVYRLSVRREEPDFHLVAISPRRDAPTALNVPRGGRALLEVLAFRHRGMSGEIQVTAKDLPPGVECPPISLGPGVCRAPLVISAEENAPEFIGAISLEGHANLGGVERRRSVCAGTMVRAGLANGSGRLTAELALAIAGEAPLQLSAASSDPEEHPLYGHLKARYFQGSVLTIAVHAQRRNPDDRDPIRLIGVGLPELVRNQTATIAAGASEGYLSFYLPPTLPPGTYTCAIRAETTAQLPSAKDPNKMQATAVIVCSNSMTFEVQPAPFIVEIELDAPRQVRRGEYVQVNYSARRQNGFIGKIHAELAAPGGVVGLRARGVTFVGQTETGELQIIANDDAPLGRQPFLYVNAIGTVEDQPIYFGSCFLDLEIVP